MSKKIKITAGKIQMSGELNESKTASLIWESLPIKAKVNTWGDEIYFSIPVKAEPENPREVVKIGDLAYWPEGSALCIFFGPTPISHEGEIRPASGVNPVGHFSGNPEVFKKVPSGESITVEKEQG